MKTESIESRLNMAVLDLCCKVNIIQDKDYNELTKMNLLKDIESILARTN